MTVYANRLHLIRSLKEAEKSATGGRSLSRPESRVLRFFLKINRGFITFSLRRPFYGSPFCYLDISFLRFLMSSCWYSLRSEVILSDLDCGFFFVVSEAD